MDENQSSIRFSSDSVKCRIPQLNARGKLESYGGDDGQSEGRPQLHCGAGGSINGQYTIMRRMHPYRFQASQDDRTEAVITGKSNTVPRLSYLKDACHTDAAAENDWTLRQISRPG